jgi:hypothetical protein
MDAVARWGVEPLHRSRRGLDEQLLRFIPWLGRAVIAQAARARAGSRFRRAVLEYAARVGIAANNRGDYEAFVVFLSPEVELELFPDAPLLRALDVEPICHGRGGYVNALELVKAEFGSLRWELRELVDPGGARFGACAEMVARGRLSGVEVRRTDFHVWQLERGLIRHQWQLGNEAAMLALLERRSDSSPG